MEGLSGSETALPIPVRLKPMRAERVAEEVEAFLSSILQRGLGLIEGQPEFHHHRLCPRHSLCRTPRLRMTKSSAYATTCARNASPRLVSRQYFRNRFM